jgi:hypothetical protein
MSVRARERARRRKIDGGAMTTSVRGRRSFSQRGEEEKKRWKGQKKKKKKKKKV